MKHKHPVPDDVMALHRSAKIVDLHIDTFMLRKLFRIDPSKRGKPPILLNWARNCVDLPRLRDGGVEIPCWGVVVQPFLRDKFFNNAMSYLDMLLEFADSHSHEMRIAKSASEIEEHLSQNLITGLLGLEGAHPLMGELSNLDTLIARGIRYMTLTHFTSNEAAIAATDSRPKFSGLSSFGVEVVQRCNELRVIVDLAHTSKTSFMQAAKLSTRPVIVSHTGVRGVHDMWRNIDDEQIDAVADTGGVVGIIFQSMFLGPKFVGSVEQWADHVDHVKNRVGIDHVAIGSDFDGMIIPPKEIQDCTDMPQITACLARRGYSGDDIRKVLGENALRVIGDVCG